LSAGRMVTDISGGRIVVGAGKPLRIQLEPRLSREGGADAGTLSVDGNAARWCDASGRLTPDKATVELRIEGHKLPVALAHALAGRPGRLSAALGERVELTVTAKGDPPNGDGEVTLDARAGERARVHVEGKLNSGTVTVRPGAEIFARGDALRVLVPDIDQIL